MSVFVRIIHDPDAVLRTSMSSYWLSPTNPKVTLKPQNLPR